MTDFINEFKEDQKNKNIKIKFDRPEKWAFESIKDLKKKPLKKESVISQTELKEIVTEAVINFMNISEKPEVIKEVNITIFEDNELGQEYIDQLKKELANLNKEADARYNEVAHQITHYMSSNPFDRFTSIGINAQEGHRMALADGQYRYLKRKAIDLEAKIRKLEKRLKK